MGIPWETSSQGLSRLLSVTQCLVTFRWRSISEFAPVARWTSRAISSRVQPAGTMTCVRERTWGANWYQPRMAWNSGVAVAPGPSIS